LVDASRIMAAKAIKRLPVVDAEGRLCGIVSRADVVRAIARVATEGNKLRLDADTAVKRR
jgi:CBS domain-containing protein